MDLQKMSKELVATLANYERLFSPCITFGKDFEPLRITPEKPYFARTEVPAFYDKKPAGTLYAIAFQLQDATGDDSTVKLQELEIPDRFKNLQDPKVILPRSKEGIHVEALFPFFTVREDGEFVRYTTSLEELTVDDPQNPKTIVKAGNLGMQPTKFVEALAGGSPEVDDIAPTNLPLFLTCGGSGDQRFGDPHSIYCAVPLGLAQVVGFLATKEAGHASLFLEKYGQKAE